MTIEQGIVAVLQSAITEDDVALVPKGSPINGQTFLSKGTGAVVRVIECAGVPKGVTVHINLPVLRERTMESV